MSKEIKETITSFFQAAKKPKGVLEELISVIGAETMKYNNIRSRIHSAQDLWKKAAEKSTTDESVDLSPSITIDGGKYIVYFEDAYNQDAIRVFIINEFDWTVTKPSQFDFDVLAILLPREIVVGSRLTNLISMIESGDELTKVLSITEKAIVKFTTPQKRQRRTSTPAVIRTKKE